MSSIGEYDHLELLSYCLTPGIPDVTHGHDLTAYSYYLLFLLVTSSQSYECSILDCPHKWHIWNFLRWRILSRRPCYSPALLVTQYTSEVNPSRLRYEKVALSLRPELAYINQYGPQAYLAVRPPRCSGGHKFLVSASFSGCLPFTPSRFYDLWTGSRFPRYNHDLGSLE